VALAGTKTSGSLQRYLLTRLVLIIPMIWILVTLVFFLMRVIGDPITAAQGGRLPPEQIAERKHAAGFDRPIFVQYGNTCGICCTATSERRSPITGRSPTYCW